MARKRMITRTLTLTRITVAIMTNDGRFETRDFDKIPLEIASKSDDKIKDYLNELYKSINTPATVVHILSKSQYEKQYGMTEEQFIAFAEEINENADN